MLDIIHAPGSSPQRLLTVLVVLQTVDLQTCMLEHKEYYADLLYEQDDASSGGGGGSSNSAQDAEAIEAKALDTMHKKAEQGEAASSSGEPLWSVAALALMLFTAYMALPRCVCIAQTPA